MLFLIFGIFGVRVKIRNYELTVNIQRSFHSDPKYPKYPGKQEFYSDPECSTLNT